VDLTIELERRLARLHELHPELSNAITLQGALISARLEMLQPDLPPLRIGLGKLAERLRTGTPALHQVPAFVDTAWSAGLFGRLIEVALEHQPEAHDRLELLASVLQEGLLDTESLFVEAFMQHRQHIAQIASDAEVDHDLLGSLAWLAVAPQLAAYAGQLAAALEGGLPVWGRGYCPVCGAWPGLAEQRGSQRQPWCRCVSCGTAWPAAPDACVYCGALPVLHLGVDADARYGVDACERCQGYLKTARAFEPSPTELLALDDLASVHLDRLAQERGYAHPTTPGFAIELADDPSPVELT
jgi:FdhE protein